MTQRGRIAFIVVAAAIVGLVGFEDSASAHDGGNGVISWADIHNNTSGTGVWEMDFYYTGHESCSGNDACSFYTQYWSCRFVPGVRACVLSIDLYHSTVHYYQYDHSVPSVIGSSGGLCWALTHYDGWDCHQTTGVERTIKACSYNSEYPWRMHQSYAVYPGGGLFATAPESNLLRCPSDTLATGVTLYSGGSLTSSDGRFTATMQSDGNFVLYHNGVGAIWASSWCGQTVFASGFRAVMQTDGNFVVYPPSGAAAWATSFAQTQPTCPSDQQTVFGSGVYMVMQPDGNLVMYKPGYGAVWHTNTCCR